MTQKEMVMAFLEENGKITTFDAFQMGITRLSARIYELKEKGVGISKTRVNYKTKAGVAKHYDVYTLGSQI